MKFLQCFPIFACKGKIDILDYSCQKLDTIPDTVFKYGKYLEDLNLSMNNIIELPLALFKMHKLQRLILSNNRIGGIPSQIGDLKYLVELDISNNEICDIAEEIEKCQQLIVLDVSHNILPGSLPKSIVNLTQLTHLSITDNSLTTLPTDIDKLVNLRSLDARECELRVLPTSIVNLKNLQRLDLGANALTELPTGFGGLENLRELDLEENTLTSLPEDLLQCKNLESLVLSNNSLTELPKDIGLLTHLIELNVNDNELMGIPSSIRLLTNLKILKLNQNSIEEVPQSVGSLESLKELYIFHNLIRSLPSSIGKLCNLEFLNASDNHIQTLPSTIGSLVNLGTLLLRNNDLKELPDEIGRLNNLKVLDLAENKLNYLPYTILAIKETLKTIYLVPDRPMKVSNLKEGIRDRFNVKTLTCYALPQKESIDVNQIIPEIKSTISGTRVNFVGDLSEVEISMDDKQPIGNFERYGTPHPKYFAPKNQQKMIQAKRNSKDLTGILAPTAEPEDLEPIIRPLRSVLKKRPQSTISLKDEITKTVIIRKMNESFGFNLFGGIDSELPFKDNDHGFFISKIVENGPAKLSGINIGDKILAVNGKPVTGLTHSQCSNLIQDGDLVELRIEQTENYEKENENPIHKNNLPKSFAPELKKIDTPGMSTDIISVTFKCDINGNPGFSVNGGTATMPIYINDIIPNGPADQTKKLKHGDRILSINGKNVQFSKLDDVQQILKANSNDLDLYVVVERLNFKSMSDLTKSLLTPSRSLPSLFDAIEKEEKKEKQFENFNRQTQASFTYGHKRKPSADFKTMLPFDQSSSFLVELSSEPQSAFIPNRTRSSGNLILEIENEEKMKISTFSNNPTQEIMSVNTPTTVTSPKQEKNIPKMSQLKQPIATLKKENSLPESSSRTPTSSSTPIPTTKIPVLNKIPPPVAPKPKITNTTKIEKLNFVSKIQMFEQEISAQTAPKNNLSNIPPPKKPLISSNDLEKLKEECKTKIENSEKEESEIIPSSSGEFEQMLDKIVTPPTMPAVIRTKKAEMRAQAAMAANISNGTCSPIPSTSSLIRSASVTSGNVSNLDEQEIERHRRWRSERMKSIEDATKNADELLNQIRQISRMSNISEPIPTS